jgi:hypothetical protein
LLLIEYKKPLEKEFGVIPKEPKNLDTPLVAIYQVETIFFGIKFSVTVAHVLRKYSHLVAPAVEAFYYRDVDDMKECLKMERFSQGGNGLVKGVMMSVTFTRHLYAMIIQQVGSFQFC